MSAVASSAARAGFLGKLPARGDFVSRGLPRSFTDPWDAWLAEVITGSRDILGEDWLPAWMEAPIWRFALPAGHCGQDSAAGVILPSVDRAGRHWPLTLAATFPGHGAAPAPGAAWFDALEEAGIQAVLADADPDRLAELIAEAPLESGSGGAYGAWWSLGARPAAPRQFLAGAMPGPAEFAAMLQDVPEPEEAAP